MDASAAETVPRAAARDPRDDGALTRIAAEVETLLGRSGASAALGFLNARTRFRFTGVYHVEPPLLRNVHLYDRENPTLNLSGEASRLDETYCSITHRTGAPFATPDASNDPGLRAYAARASVLSYCGVPIGLDDGRPWGTLCHFDVRPRLLSSEELAVLAAVARVFGRLLSETRRPC